MTGKGSTATQVGGPAPSRKGRVPLCGVDVSLWQLLPALLVLLLGTGLAVTLSFLLSSWQQNQNLDLYEIEGIRQLSSLKRGIEAFRPDNEALLSFMQLNPNATYAEFAHFASRMIAASSLKGAQQALSYLPNTPNSRRAEFEKAVCDEFCEVTGRTYETMYIRNTTGQPEIPKDRYFAVHYIYPLETNLGAIMFDISSSAARNISINKAIETDDYQATPRITLVQESESAGGSYGFLVIRPIYSLAETMQDGRMVLEPNPDVLQGLKSIVVRVKELVESAAREANIPRIEIFLFDSSNDSELGGLCTVSPPPRVCEPAFLHALQTDGDAEFAWSRGFKVVGDNKVPWYTVEDVLQKSEETIFVFEGEFEVFGRTWSFVMLGDEEYWNTDTDSWLLISIVMIFTVLCSLLMLSSARQAAINAKLQEKDIARLKVITMQQSKDRVIAAATDVRNILKGMVLSRYPDGSEKVDRHVKPSKRAAQLQQADGISVVCMVLADKFPANLNRSIQQIISEAFNEFLNKCYGLEASGLDGSGDLMALFPTTMDACSFVCQLLQHLTEHEWPEQVAQLPQCEEVSSEHGILLKRGPRMKACIHWAGGEENTWSENAAGGAEFGGIAHLLTSEVAKNAAPGQVLITKAASDQQLGRSEDSFFLHMNPVGYHKVFNKVMLLSEVVPQPWDKAMRGLTAAGDILGLEKVRKAPRCLVGPPGASGKPITNQDQPVKKPTSNTSNSSMLDRQNLTLVTIKFGGIKNIQKRDAITDQMEELVLALAQTYCGYVALQEGSENLEFRGVFLSVVNAVRFCSSMQVALARLPWDESSGGRDQNKASSNKPCAAMLISTLGAGRFTWRGPLTKSRAGMAAMGLGGASRTNLRKSLDQSNLAGEPAINRRISSSAGPSVLGTIDCVPEGVSADRPYLSLHEDIRVLNVHGLDANFAASVLAHVAQGQVIICGNTWEMLGSLPDETRAIYLGKYKLLPEEDSIKMIEIQTRGLQAQQFPRLPRKLQLEEGYHDAPSGEDGIAYLMIQVKSSAKQGSVGHPIFCEGVELLNRLIRSLLKPFQGYECDYKDPCAFNLAFPAVQQAMHFAITVQKRAMDLPYSDELLDLKGCEEVLGSDGTVIFRGIRMKMGICFGTNAVKRPSASGRADYAGAFFNICAASVQVASPGQIMIDGDSGLHDENSNLKTFTLDEPGKRPILLEVVGFYHLKGVAQPINLVSALHPDHAGRVFSPPPGRVSQGVHALTRPEAKRMYDNRTDSSQLASVNESLTGMMQELMGKRMGWSDQKFKSDEVVEIQTIIGMGNFGKVYRGLWKGVTVAYKVIQYPEGTVGEQEQYKTTAVMETAISASMSHPNVVQTYSYDIKPIMGLAKGAEESGDSNSVDKGKDWDANQTSAADIEFKRKEEKAQKSDAMQTVLMWEVKIIQEYCSQGSLRQVLDDKTFLDEETNMSDLSFALKIVGDIARGMMHIHSMQIVHGDLKAHNILIADSNGVTAKVADFGLSIKMDTEQTHVSGVHAGTLNHMAPEILMSGHISKAADVYAFGILMYETMTTLKAFRGIPMHLISNKICNARERPRFLPGCPQSYVQLATQCWDHDPAKRPTFKEVIQALDAMDAAHKAGELPGYSAANKHLPQRAPQATHELSIPEEMEFSGSVIEISTTSPVSKKPAVEPSFAQQGKSAAVLAKIKENHGAIPIPEELSGSYFFYSENEASEASEPLVKASFKSPTSTSPPQTPETSVIGANPPRKASETDASRENVV